MRIHLILHKCYLIFIFLFQSKTKFYLLTHQLRKNNFGLTYVRTQRKKQVKPLFTLIICLFVLVNVSLAETEIGIDEKLGTTIPLDLTFQNEEGDTVVLKDLIDKPTILSLVYFTCPGICTPLLNGSAQVISRVDLEPGKDFNFISISFDSSDTHQIAMEKKKNYLKEKVKRNIQPDAWKFLVGNQESIDKIVDAIGFKYQESGEGYLHSGALVAISPEGKITRYLYGLEFLPFDLKMAVIEASEGRVNSTITKLLKYCYNYDPQGKSYVIDVKKVVGSVMLIILALFFISLVVLKKKPPRNA